MLHHPLYWLLLVLVLTLSERRSVVAARADAAGYQQRGEPATQRPPFLTPA